MRSRHSPPESLLFAEFCKKFPVLRRMSRGDRFVSDCAPPSSLRKPHDSDTTQNRAFLRGSPATYFTDFGLCGRSTALAAVFGALSPHPKIPFPAAGFGHEIRPHLRPQFRVLRRGNSGSLVNGAIIPD